MSLNRDVLHSERCASAFGRMFWAFLFFLDFRLGYNEIHVDILPDFIGWILIATALTSILDLAQVVAGVRILAYWLVFLSLFDLVEIHITLSRSGNMTTWISPTFPVQVVVAVLDIVLVWRLCGLIIEMALAAENTTIRDRASFRRKLYVALAVLATLATPVLFVAPGLALAAVIIGLPVAITVFCLMMGLMRGTEKMCRGAPV